MISIGPFPLAHYYFTRHTIIGMLRAIILLLVNVQNISVAYTLCHAVEAHQLTRLRTLAPLTTPQARYNSKHHTVVYVPHVFVWLGTTVRKLWSMHKVAGTAFWHVCQR
uniref:Tick transposon n=1 Tax=Rhipicephalus appendiculatus TaxID=34631 RepID=A0A131Z2Y7_RHIAP